MDDTLIQVARDMDPEKRETLERFLGRRLLDEEGIQLRVTRFGAVPSRESGDESARRTVQFLDELASLRPSLAEIERQQALKPGTGDVEPILTALIARMQRHIKDSEITEAQFGDAVDEAIAAVRTKRRS